MRWNTKSFLSSMPYRKATQSTLDAYNLQTNFPLENAEHKRDCANIAEVKIPPPKKTPQNDAFNRWNILPFFCFKPIRCLLCTYVYIYYKLFTYNFAYSCTFYKVQYEPSVDNLSVVHVHLCPCRHHPTLSLQLCARILLNFSKYTIIVNKNG